MNEINAIVINDTLINPNHFAVKCNSVDEIKRCLIASSEFISWCGVSTEDDVDEFGDFGVKFNFNDGWSEDGSTQEVACNGGLYEENGDIIISTDHGSEVKFQLSGYCIVTLCGNGYSEGGYFESQKGTALGRFLGQGLTFVDPSDVETVPLDSNGKETNSVTPISSGKSIAWYHTKSQDDEFESWYSVKD